MIKTKQPSKKQCSTCEHYTYFHGDSGMCKLLDAESTCNWPMKRKTDVCGDYEARGKKK